MLSSSRQTETLGAGADEQNQARAEGFVKMVAAAGEDWPDGWVKGQGFVLRLEQPVFTAPAHEARHGRLPWCGITQLSWFTTPSIH